MLLATIPYTCAVVLMVNAAPGEIGKPVEVVTPEAPIYTVTLPMLSNVTAMRPVPETPVLAETMEAADVPIDPACEAAMAADPTARFEGVTGAAAEAAAAPAVHIVSGEPSAPPPMSTMTLCVLAGLLAVLATVLIVSPPEPLGSVVLSDIDCPRVHRHDYALVSVKLLAENENVALDGMTC